MCQTYDKSKGGDTRGLQSRMVPPKKKLGRVTLIRMLFPCVYVSLYSYFVQKGANAQHEISETPGGYNILLTILMPL